MPRNRVRRGTRYTAVITPHSLDGQGRRLASRAPAPDPRARSRGVRGHRPRPPARRCPARGPAPRPAPRRGGRPARAAPPPAPPAVVAGPRAVLRPEQPLEPGADLVVVTSGSTGGGRAALLSAAAVRGSAAATLERLGGPGHWLLALPVSAIAGLQVLCRSVLAGSPPTVRAREEPLSAAVARMPAGRRYTALVPTQLRRFLAAEAGALRAFDAVLVGGAATDAALLRRARQEDVRVVTTYGMTETAGGCVYDGHPLDGVQVRVRNSEVELAGPTLALGYRLDPAATGAAFAAGWFATRDAGSLDADGRLTVHGRLDDVLVTGGVNVAPQAVGAALRATPPAPGP